VCVRLVLNVGNTQEVYNSKPKGDAHAKAEVAGRMAQGFTNSSILAYYMFDEVGPKSMALDKAVTQAVTGNDTNHPTFSLVCGVQCSGWFDGLNARRYAEQHSVVAVDSCERASRRQAWPSCSDHRNNNCFLTKPHWFLKDLACFV
jgi:hypothetical protein